ncbi:sigma-70 family RNA polymerase sigma factor [Myxococcota bacterium]|nr:sigma-70 family RNA polymerase sigma factor [Myxococcota bacterium]
MPPTDPELRHLYERYGPVILHRCRRILGDEEEAMDAVQETFARVVQHWDGFRQDASPLTWMYRISTNWCLNQLRNRRGRADKQDRHHALLEGLSGRVLSAERWEDRDTVRALLQDEEEQTQAIVVHLFFDDLSKEETARLVGLSVPTVRKRLNDFLARAQQKAGPLVAAGAALLLLVLP